MALTANNRGLCWPLVGVVDVCGLLPHPTPHFFFWGPHLSNGSIQTVMHVPMTSSPRSLLIQPGLFLLADTRIDLLSETKWVLTEMVGRTRSDNSNSLRETGNRVGLGEEDYASLISHPFFLKSWLMNWIWVWFRVSQLPAICGWASWWVSLSFGSTHFKNEDKNRTYSWEFLWVKDVGSSWEPRKCHSEDDGGDPLPPRGYSWSSQTRYLGLKALWNQFHLQISLPPSVS